MTFSDYFKMSSAERRGLRARLYALRTDSKAGEPAPLNYEAQQPPLAYVPLAVLQWIAPEASIPWMVYRLRLFGAFASLSLMVYATLRLGQSMGLRPAYLSASVFLLLVTQNVYGAVAHVANDWLSAPLIPLLFLAAESFWRKPAPRTAALFALTLAAGLLAKAYFLAFVPFAIGLVLWIARRQIWVFAGLLALTAGPWYLRNLLLYDSLTGLQTSIRSIPNSAVIKTFWSVSWPSALRGMLHAALWNANNSFTTFSRTTLDLMLILLGAGAALWLRLLCKKQGQPADWLIAGGTAVFSATLIYAMVLAGTMVGGVYPNATAWYSAGLLPGMFLVAIKGLSDAGRTGRWLAKAVLATSVYVLALTYFFKLIPLYAGLERRADFRMLYAIYWQRAGETFARLGDASMLNGVTVTALALATVVLAGFVCCRVCRALD
jgi:hypothetical protein